MSKRSDSKAPIIGLIGAALLLIGFVSVHSAERPGSPASEAGASASSVSSSEIVPGIAHADADMLELQLD